MKGCFKTEYVATQRRFSTYGEACLLVCERSVLTKLYLAGGFSFKIIWEVKALPSVSENLLRSTNKLLNDYSIFENY